MEPREISTLLVHKISIVCRSFTDRRTIKDIISQGEYWTEERKTEKSDAGGRHYGRKNEYRIKNSE
jgi:hypothetical protein